MLCCSSLFSNFGKWHKRDLPHETSGEESPRINHNREEILSAPEHHSGEIISENDCPPPPPYQASLPESVHYDDEERAVPMNRNSGPGKQYSIGLVLTQAIREGDVKVTIELLQKGADPNVKDSYGYALTQAIRNGDVKVTMELLQKGAIPNVKDCYGYALAQARGSKELEEALISQFGY